MNRSIIVKANNSGFDVDKFVANLPVPVEYAYAGVAWGALRITRLLNVVRMLCDGSPRM